MGAVTMVVMVLVVVMKECNEAARSVAEIAIDELSCVLLFCVALEDDMSYSDDNGQAKYRQTILHRICMPCAVSCCVCVYVLCT
jgi:hypothetical protein